MLKLSFKQQVFIGFAVSVLLVLLVGVLAYKSINQLEDDSALVDHTQKVIKTSTGLLQLTIDAETGMRGYVTTNNKVFLAPYNDAVPEINSDLEELRETIPNNPVQIKILDSLTVYVNKQLAFLKANIEILPQKGINYILQNQTLLNGKHNMDEIRLLDSNLIDAEDRLLTIRKARTGAASSEALDIMLIGTIIFLIIIVVLFFYIQETFEQQKKIENEIKITNAELENVLAENKAQNWLLKGAGLLNEKMQGQQSERELAENILTVICNYSKALTGTLYLFNEASESLNLYATYAFNDPDTLKKTVKLSEGWLGQAARGSKAAVIKGKLNDKLELGSSIIKQDLIESIITPFFFDKKLKGVIEIAFNDGLSDDTKEFILRIANDIGIAVNTAQARTIVHELLSQVQQQTEELESQQEEMRITNEELMNKTEMLQTSEEELIVQQEELRSTNTELQEKANLLEEKNQAIEEARIAINQKMQELEASGKYKSEFLANMSHELRTPLNSILVLARILQDNKPVNLTEDQVKYASVIFNAGNDLLSLINDILDLSKIESGKMEVRNEAVKIEEILHSMEMLFTEMASSKKIKYIFNTSDELPKSLFTDKGKLEQVLKNLLSNAFKFTPENGAVTITVIPGEDKAVSFCVKDTGIGIPADKQKIIFEAFQQADGSTSRRYGGTGLGLSISRELASLLDGKITLNSTPGEGSEFILTVPLAAKAKTPAEEQLPTIETFKAPAEFLKPAREIKRDGQPLVVIVEDDKNFAEILKDYSLDHGYRSILVNDGAAAVDIIKEKQPDAVILDIMLPGKDGWQILKELKHDDATSHIPVHLMSANDVTASRANREGAISFLKKPVNPQVLDKLFGDIMRQSGVAFKQVLLIEDNKMQNHALHELLQNQGIAVDQAFDGATAFEMLNKNRYQCVILDLSLPDISGLDLLDKIKAIDRFKSLPVIINTAMELDKTSVSRLMKYANAMVVKTNKSTGRLIDEVNLFLNKVGTLAARRAALPGVKIADSSTVDLKGKKILIVDDDMRNVFALSSALENDDLLVEVAADGQEAIDKLQNIADIDLVLMDIMMPVMDGYEAIRYIRSQNKWARLPVIALTAKAMMDDREKCMAAGASDYVTKPVDVEQLISLMRLWLSR